MTAPARPPMGGGPAARMMAGGMPAEKLQDFKGSTRRLLGMLKPQRLLVGVVLLFGIASVFLLAPLVAKVARRDRDLIREADPRVDETIPR